MNYRHRYHAGNFGDVLRHTAQCLILESLVQKEKGFTYIDTHAGIGLYDLKDQPYGKEEYILGVEKIISLSEVPASLKTYYEIVKPFYFLKENSFYPGSPLIAKHFLRPQDQMILNEWHPEDGIRLKEFFRGEARIFCHGRDAYEFLPAVLPPKPRRGLVMIDPPYEKKNELSVAMALLKEGIKKFPEGIYLLWYPIKEYQNEEVIRRIKKEAFSEEGLHIELVVQKPSQESTKLLGSGLILINPPWQIEQKITSLLKDLYHLLSFPQEGYWRVTSF